jgi:hypothetical protein
LKKVFLIISAALLISVSSNCQWYQKLYGVNDLNQLSKEQLNIVLKKAKGRVATGITLSAVSTIGIISGIYLFRKDYPDDVYPDQAEMGKQFEGLGLALISIPLEIAGLVMMKKNRSVIMKIKEGFNNTEIQLGLFKYPSGIVSNSSFGSTIPGFSVTFRF